MKLHFKEVRTVISNIKTFVFTPEGPLSWQAGQYIHYTLPHNSPDDRGDERWFTIASAPFEEEVWITTRIFGDEASSFKKALQELQPGQELEVDMPEGGFTDSDTDKQYVFIAGGIGITPFRSILTQLNHEDKAMKIELLYANRGADDILFKDELESLSNTHSDFNITYFIGDNQITEDTLKQINEKFDDPYYYISGPEPMVEAFKATLINLGVDEAHLKLDHFPGYKAI